MDRMPAVRFESPIDSLHLTHFPSFLPHPHSRLIEHHKDNPKVFRTAHAIPVDNVIGWGRSTFAVSSCFREKKPCGLAKAKHCKTSSTIDERLFRTVSSSALQIPDTVDDLSLLVVISSKNCERANSVMTTTKHDHTGYTVRPCLRDWRAFHD